MTQDWSWFVRGGCLLSRATSHRATAAPSIRAAAAVARARLARPTRKLDRAGRCFARSVHVSSTFRPCNCSSSMFEIDFNLNTTILSPSIKDPLSVFVCNSQFPLQDLLLLRELSKLLLFKCLEFSLPYVVTCDCTRGILRV